LESKTVQDLMIPLSEYATVSEDATLHEAILALDKSQKEFDRTHYKHRAILVYDKTNKIVGKLSQLDIIRSLEPKYEQMGKSNPLSHVGLSRFGFSPQFMKEIVKQFRLWEKPIEETCRDAGKLKVKDVMYTPTEGEYVEDTATLAVAVHQLLMGLHQSLLVTHGKEIVGILRLTDVFQEVKTLIIESQTNQ
jgi:CBS domain-containing protein